MWRASFISPGVCRLSFLTGLHPTLSIEGRGEGVADAGSAPVALGRAVETLLQPGPAVDVVVLADLGLGGKARQHLGKARLEHKRQRVLELDRLELDPGRLVVAIGIRPVRQ